jgi:redox-sensitive bicupin YhaK (pirin superfamily)
MTTNLPPGIVTIIVPRSRDIGDFEVRRVLPAIGRRMVGPFIFLDQMGPAAFQPGQGIDVRPHPHIGLATVTYLLRGNLVHRDSLGSVQTIVPGDVNWMTAGRGIVHSERSDTQLRQQPHEMYGLQSWVALPAAREEIEPSFAHHAGADLPTIEGEGIEARLIAGTAFGRTAPVKTLSELFYVDVRLQPGAQLSVAPEHEERAIYLLEGTVEIDGRAFDPGRLLVLAGGHEAIVRAIDAARLMLLGGEPMEGPRYIWWNFVSSRRERIEDAKTAWKQHQFGVAVPDETEFIPLPDGP